MKFRSHRVPPLFVALAASMALSACAGEQAGDGAGDSASAPTTVAAEADAAPSPQVAGSEDVEGAADAMADASAMMAAGGWNYGSTPTDGGEAATARITGSLDGGGSVELVFTDDPTWGATATIEGLPGPIECPDGCRAGISIDGAPETSVPASRPQAEAGEPVLSLRKPRDLWRDLDGASELRLALPGERTAVFQVEGLDTSRLPGLE